MTNHLPPISFAPCSCGSHATDLTRRSFISRAFGLGIGTVGALSGCSSLLSPTARGSNGLIDVHHHHIPPFYLEEYQDRIAATRGGKISQAWLNWSPEKAIQAMDAANVSTAVLSLTTPGVWFGDPVAASRTARQVNEYAAELAKNIGGDSAFLPPFPYPTRKPV